MNLELIKTEVEALLRELARIKSKKVKEILIDFQDRNTEWLEGL